MSLRRRMGVAATALAMCVMVVPSAGAEVIDLRKNPDPASAAELGVNSSADEEVDAEGRAEAVAMASVDIISDFLDDMDESTAKPAAIARIGVLTTIADVEDYTHQAGEAIYDFIENLKSTPEYSNAMVDAPTSIEDTKGLNKMVGAIKKDAGDLDVSALEAALKGKGGKPQKSTTAESEEDSDPIRDLMDKFVPREGEPSPLPREDSDSAKSSTSKGYSESKSEKSSQSTSTQTDSEE